jgi:hypothetical protein
MIQGEFSRASRKTSRTMRGPYTREQDRRNILSEQITYWRTALTSPRYFCTNSEPTTRMNDAEVAFATALTIIVLPVPRRYIRSVGHIPRRNKRGGLTWWSVEKHTPGRINSDLPIQIHLPPSVSYTCHFTPMPGRIDGSCSPAARATRPPP